MNNETANHGNDRPAGTESHHAAADSLWMAEHGGSSSANTTPIFETYTLRSTLSATHYKLLQREVESRGIRDPEEDIVRFSQGRRGTYSEFMADLLAYASTWAYSDPATFALMMAYRGMRRWRIQYMRVRNDPQFVVASAYLLQSYTGDVGILVFRGTEPLNTINWLADLRVRTASFLQGKAHGGIVGNLRAIWPLIALGLNGVADRQSLLSMDASLHRIRSANGHDEACEEEHHSYQEIYDSNPFEGGEKRLRPLKAFYVTGHSLGAAMAALAGPQVMHSPKWPKLRDALAGCYTYGAPMVAAPGLAEQLDKAVGHVVFRHTYRNDVVPQLPPRTTGPFQHFGQHLRSDEDGTGWRRDSKRDRQWKNAATLPLASLPLVLEQFRWTQRLANRIPISITDHMPSNYERISQRSQTNIM